MILRWGIILGYLSGLHIVIGEGGKRVKIRKRFEDSELLTLKMEEGGTRKEMH